jgi:ABC-2 type transport system ATP-binding protein
VTMSNKTTTVLPEGIIIKNITKKFRDFTALENISIDIMRGEIFGLLGPNGAGKTTLLNILCGLSKPTSGEAIIFGMNFKEHYHKIRKLLGYVPQETALYEHLTAEENLMFHARFYGVSRKKRKLRVQQALELAQLESRRNSRVKEFSGGMKRRLALVRALIHEPGLLMLDEPSLGIDVQSRMEIWNKIKEMRKDKTIIITTNYMEEADYLCDRVAIIDQGYLIAEDTPASLKKEHLGDVVELNIPSPPRHFIENITQIYAEIAQNPVIEEVPEKADGWYRVSLRLPDAGSRITKLIEITKNAGAAIAEIEVRAPSLNDVFIELTGKGLRD